MSDHVSQLQQAGKSHAPTSEAEGQGGVSMSPPAFQLKASPPGNPDSKSATAQLQGDKDGQKGKNTPKRVMVVGSPSPNELKNHPYQFANAAKFQGVDENTVWLVEKTGYDLGGVSTSAIESMAAPGKVIWITPESGLTSALNSFPAHGIKELKVYSHGLAGMLTLRYGWTDKGAPNYGLSLGEVKGLSGDRLTPEAKIEFNSCNTGTDTDSGNLAKEIAKQTNHPVSAWTGRTSYSEVNDGAGDGDTAIHGSSMDKGGGRLTGGYDMKEVFSQTVLGRTPNLQEFKPGNGFISTIAIVARLPETRKFYVQDKGSVELSFTNPYYDRPFRQVRDSDQITVILHKSIDWGMDENKGERILTPSKNDKASYSNLTAGQYYFEIINRNAPVNPYETFTAGVSVKVP